MPVQPPSIDLSRVPSELREHDRWVCWRFEDREGKPTKVPYDAVSGLRASTTDQTTWHGFETAVAAFEGGGYEGVGFVFAEGGGFCGIDLDDCIGEDGVISDGALAIIARFGSYSEISPSGRGVKIFIRGIKPEGARSKVRTVPGTKAVEVYDHGRFFTVTGGHVEGTPIAVNDRQAELETFCREIFPPEPKRATGAATTAAAASGGVDPDDARLLDRARCAGNGTKFASLFDKGDTSEYGGDESAADQALCNLLWFWTCDIARVDRLFRGSALYREKWERVDYRARTLAKAAEGRVWSPPVKNGAADTDATPGVGSHAIAPEDDNGLIRLGERDPDSGRLVLAPRRTLPTAQAFVREFHQHPGGTTLRNYGGMMLEWRGNRYQQVEDEAVRSRLHPWLHESLRYVLNRKTGLMELAPFESNPGTVKAALDTVRTVTHLPVETPVPSWLGPADGLPDPTEILACRSKNIHIPTGLVIPATPALFTTNALEFDYDPNAEPPEQWIKFLEQVFGEDIEAVQTLQEFAGYLLTPDTSQQKILFMLGPKRSGKGTIVRMFSRLVGLGNVVAPTTSSLAGPFGLQPLLGKSLATINDARFKGESVATTTERILTITGEDYCTVDMKHRESITTKLKTRFIIVSNEIPRLTDAAGALANRFIVLRMTNSFFGREDPTLTDRLCTELPGILLWAIDGWKRLRARGRFVQPASAGEAMRDLEDLSSPVGAFVRDTCEVGVGHRVIVDDLFAAWQNWCQAEGIDHVPSKAVFGRDLMAAFPQVRKRKGTAGVQFYDGVALARPSGIPV